MLELWVQGPSWALLSEVWKEELDSLGIFLIVGDSDQQMPQACRIRVLAEGLMKFWKILSFGLYRYDG